MKKPNFPIEAGLALEGQLKTKDGTPTSGDVTLSVNGYTDIRKLKSKSDGAFILNDITYRTPFELAVQAVSRDEIPFKNISLETKDYPVKAETVQFSFAQVKVQEVAPLSPEELRKNMAVGELLTEEAVAESKGKNPIGPMPCAVPDNVVEVEDLILNGDPPQFLNRPADKISGYP